jgi:hypothetical protein
MENDIRTLALTLKSFGLLELDPCEELDALDTVAVGDP